MKKTFFMAFSGVLFAGCQMPTVTHTTHNKRTADAKTATQILSTRYQQLKIEETKVAGLNCPSVQRRDARAERTLNHLHANNIHPHEGQSALHIPTHLDIHNAEIELDKLSDAIEECHNQPNLKTEHFQKETL